MSIKSMVQMVKVEVDARRLATAMTHIENAEVVARAAALHDARTSRQVARKAMRGAVSVQLHATKRLLNEIVKVWS